MESSPEKGNRPCQWKPLQGYSFYIDVGDGDDGAEAVEQLVGKIMSLGGYIKRILSQNVLYFITAGSRKPKHRVKIRRSSRFLKQNETRAKTKLRNVPVIQHCETLSAVDRAKKLGLNIFTIDKVMKWLTEIERKRLSLHHSPKCKLHCGEDNDGKPKREYEQSNLPSNNKDTDDSRQSIESLSHFKFLPTKNNDEELQPPFIKVEDIDSIYQPQYLELTSFPTICFETRVPRSPFQKIDMNGTIGNSAPAVSGQDPEKSISSTSNYSKSGYCDFCECFFRCRDRHITTKKHQCNIPYENFKKLDDLIVNGVPFDEFLKSMLKKKISQEVLCKMERQKELTDFLKTLEGKRKAREFFTDLNGFMDYTERKKDLGVSDGHGKKVIR